MEQYKRAIREFQQEIRLLEERIQSCERKLERLMEVYRVQENKLFKLEF